MRELEASEARYKRGEADAEARAELHERNGNRLEAALQQEADLRKAAQAEMETLRGFVQQLRSGGADNVADTYDAELARVRRAAAEERAVLEERVREAEDQAAFMKERVRELEEAEQGHAAVAGREEARRAWELVVEGEQAVNSRKGDSISAALDLSLDSEAGDGTLAGAVAAARTADDEQRLHALTDEVDTLRQSNQRLLASVQSLVQTRDELIEQGAMSEGQLAAKVRELERLRGELRLLREERNRSIASGEKEKEVVLRTKDAELKRLRQELATAEREKEELLHERSQGDLEKEKRDTAMRKEYQAALDEQVEALKQNYKERFESILTRAEEEREREKKEKEEQAVKEKEAADKLEAAQAALRDERAAWERKKQEREQSGEALETALREKRAYEEAIAAKDGALQEALEARQAAEAALAEERAETEAARASLAEERAEKEAAQAALAEERAEKETTQDVVEKERDLARERVHEAVEKEREQARKDLEAARRRWEADQDHVRTDATDEVARVRREKDAEIEELIHTWQTQLASSVAEGLRKKESEWAREKAALEQQVAQVRREGAEALVHARTGWQRDGGGKEREWKELLEREREKQQVQLADLVQRFQMQHELFAKKAKHFYKEQLRTIVAKVKADCRARLLQNTSMSMHSESNASVTLQKSLEEVTQYAEELESELERMRRLAAGALQQTPQQPQYYGGAQQPRRRSNSTGAQYAPPSLRASVASSASWTNAPSTPLAGGSADALRSSMSSLPGTTVNYSLASFDDDSLYDGASVASSVMDQRAGWTQTPPFVSGGAASPDRPPLYRQPLTSDQLRSHRQNVRF